MPFRLVVPFVVALLALSACSPEKAPVSPQGEMPSATSDASPPGQPGWYVPAADERSEVALLKSPADDRSYRYLTLDNGMKVVLISDPDADKAAASLSVDVGSFENPADRDGLAHFLEHMLFLGTDKYPEPGEYQAHLSEHGGTFNAYTSLEETNYFFDVDASYLAETLDRFSRFFVAPLFNEEYVDRERHAVDSEYQLKIKDDSRREWDVLRELANPEHPFSKFSVGSLETLANPEDNPVREDLIAFYERYYSASEMNLVVMGREPLDALEQAVVSRFAEVPARDVELPKSNVRLFDADLPLEVHIKPVKDRRTLSFNFPMPSVEDSWRLKPTEYLGYLLGHEGEGSLLAELKKRGLAEGLSSGLVFDSRKGALFSVQISLTPAGVTERDRVTRAFFSWLELIKEKGLEQWRYEEMARLSELEFQFLEEKPPMGYVSGLSRSLHQYSPEEVLRGNYLYAGFDEKELQGYASYLGADNVAIVLSAPEVNTDRNTVLYDAPYSLVSVTRDELVADPGAMALQLPEENPYVADSVALLNISQPPARPVASEQMENLWYYPDTEFATPKASYQARVALPDMNTLERTVQLEFLLALVEDQLSSEVYPAMLAGLGFSLAAWEHGFAISLTGYSDKQDVLLARILSVLKSPDWNAERAERVRGMMVRRLRNTTEDWPLRQLFKRLGPLLTETWLPTQKADVLEVMSLDQVRAFHSAMLSSGKGRFYAGGNLTEAEAAAMAQATVDALALNNSDLVVEQRVRNLVKSSALPATRYYVNHDDSAALLYLQGDEDSLQERATMAVLEVMASAPFYSSLRTDKQLGYAVGSSIAPMVRVPGVLFYVQSPKVDSASLREEINGFLQHFKETVAQTDEEAFARYRQSVLATIEERPRNINEVADRHLESLDLGYQDFDFRDRLIAALNELTVDDIKAAYQRLMVGERTGLWILSSENSEVGVGQPVPEEFLEGIYDYHY